MEKIIAELKELVPFKDTTEIGDIVMVVAEDPQMAAYAMMTNIERDLARQDEWWEVHMQLLSVPLQHLVWTLRVEQFTGQEIFTMGGKARFVKAVRFEKQPLQPDPKTNPESFPSKQEKNPEKSWLRRVK
jgi:hypothetical protein